MAEITLTVANRAISLPQTVPQQIAETEYIDKIKFNCDSEYNGYTLVAVFKNGEHGKTFPVTVPADRSAVDIDPRALRRAGALYIGMFGVDGQKTLPTLWAPAIEIKDGTDVGADADTEETPALAARVTALETAVDSLGDTVDDLCDTVEAFAEEVVTLDNAVDELNDTVEGLADDVDELTETVEGKQDVITDLDTIRNGAALGETALQSVPIATSDNIGGAKFQNALGMGIFSDGSAYIVAATNAQIANRTNNNRPITPSNMDLAVSTALCDPVTEYTDEQKAAACATIGAEYKGKDNWENVATLDAEQTQFEIDLNEYTEICIESHLRAAQNVNLRVNDNMILFSNIAINGGRSVYAEWADNNFGFCSRYAMCSSGYDNVTNAVSCESQCYGATFNISGIYKFYLDATITEGSVEIYAR